MGPIFCFYSPLTSLPPADRKKCNKLNFEAEQQRRLSAILKARLKVYYTKQPQPNYRTVAAIKSGSAAAACATCGAALTSFNYDYSKTEWREPQGEMQ